MLYSWKDGEPQEVQVRSQVSFIQLECKRRAVDRPQEVAGLAHSPRAITFVDGETLCWGHTPTDYCLTSMSTSVTVDVTTPIPATSSTNSIGMGMGALSGLGGYMTLGLGAKAKPNVIHINDHEALIAYLCDCNENMKLMITCRPHVLPSELDEPTIPIEASEGDMQVYIEGQVQRCPPLRRLLAKNSVLREEVISHAIRKAQRM